jgi:16S rRNA (cytidine1402-2'-O)-methyltransferase
MQGTVMSGTLYVVATPIGNLDDLTARARQTLAAVDLIAVEDTRHSGRLLSHIGVKTRLIAMHDHNEEQVLGKVIEVLLAGESVALISDAGTPLLSDPGYRLVQAAHANDITVSPIPGASALTAALSAAGLPTDRFCFEGFPPSKKMARREWLQNLCKETRTIVMYESVHRIADSLADMVDVFGADRKAFIGRELTKIHEQCVQDTLGGLRAAVESNDIVSKGEFVLVVAGAVQEADSSIDVDRLLTALVDKLSAKDAARVVADVTGEKKNALYERLLKMRD